MSTPSPSAAPSDAAPHRHHSSPGHFPVGAFVVRDSRSLGPLVARLRRAGRLKAGTNVTPFDPRFARLADWPTARAADDGAGGGATTAATGAENEEDKEESEGVGRRRRRRPVIVSCAAARALPSRAARDTSAALQCVLVTLSEEEENDQPPPPPPDGRQRHKEDRKTRQEEQQPQAPHSPLLRQRRHLADEVVALYAAPLVDLASVFPGAAHSFMAVHVTGEWSAEQLLQQLLADDAGADADASANGGSDGNRAGEGRRGRGPCRGADDSVSHARRPKKHRTEGANTSEGPPQERQREQQNATTATAAVAEKDSVDSATGEEALAPAPPAAQTPRAAPASPPLFFLSGVRVFHRACCPDIQKLPPALQVLRALPDSASADDTASDVTTTTATTASASGFTFSELFAGIGMFGLGLRAAGGTELFASEMALPAQQVMSYNYHAEGVRRSAASPSPCARCRCCRCCCVSGGDDGSASRQPSSWEALLTPCAPVGVASGRPLRQCVCAANSADANARGLSLMAGGDTTTPLPIVGDVTEVPSAFFPAHDVLTAGFPCQSFAKAGTAAGLGDSRGWLFYEVVRVVAAARPCVFVLENVENLLSLGGGAQLDEIRAHLERPARASADGSRRTDSGCLPPLTPPPEYAVSHRVLDGAAVSPQTRRRVYFVGARLPAASGPDSGPSAAAAAVRAALSDVWGTAAALLEAVGAASPYRRVRDVLLPPARPPDCCCCHRHSPLGAAPTLAAAAAAERLQLTETQYAALRRVPSFTRRPEWRLADLDGRARTLMGSYRGSYQLYSEFVPLTAGDVAAAGGGVFATATTTPTTTPTTPTPATRASTTDSGRRTAAAAAAAGAGADAREAGTGGEAGGGTRGGASDGDVGAEAAAAAAAGGCHPYPPLRFYATRECARLQGIPDSFLLSLSDQSRGGAPSASAAAASPAAAAAAAPPPPCSLPPPGAAYKLVGNAVNPLVIRCIALAMVKHGLITAGASATPFE